MSKKLDFFRALKRLEEGLTKDITDDLVVDGIIQRFEFTFEQAWKVMKLHLEDQGILDEATAVNIVKLVKEKYIMELNDLKNNL